jgi:hypothetical protein
MNLILWVQVSKIWTFKIAVLVRDFFDILSELHSQETCVEHIFLYQKWEGSYYIYIYYLNMGRSRYDKLKLRHRCVGIKVGTFSFIHSSMALHPFLGTDLFFSFVIFFTRTVGPLGRVISPSQGRYVHKGQHKHRINAHTNIHTLSGIRSHDPSVREGEDGSCLGPRGHCERLALLGSINIFIFEIPKFFNENVIYFQTFPYRTRGYKTRD